MTPEHHDTIRPTVLTTFQRQGVIPSFYHTDAHTLLYILQIVYRCGVRSFEFVHHRDSRSLHFFSLLMKEAESMPDLKVGVGAVLNPSTARSYIKAGASFVVSPFLHEQTAQHCHDHNVLWVPGCSNVQDAEIAMNLGADAITMLPVSGSGMNLVKQMLQVHPTVTLIPSFGIRIEESALPLWFEAGAQCIRLGNALFPKEAIAIRDWTKIELHVYGTLESVKQIKNKLRRKNLQSVL